jgi:large subunit ribosomal protein L25
MTEIATLVAERRERAGKGTARSVRRKGYVPGVVYGGNAEPTLISLDIRTVVREAAREGFMARLYELDIQGTKERVLARDVQYHPVTDWPVHIDFLRVSAGTRIRIGIPVHFTDEDQSPGIKRGGVVNVVRHEIESYVPVDNIPPYVTVSLKGLDIGDSIHIRSVTLPEGMRPVIQDRDFTIASIAPPTTAEAEAPGAAAAAEAAPAAAAPAAAAAKAPAAAGAKKG